MNLSTKIPSCFYCIPILRHSLICRIRQLKPLYKQLNTQEGMKKKVKEKTVILMVRNETTFCGGLSDRFRGIISVYQECKQQGLDFRIHFETPKLIDYLEPNKYDWFINDEDICYDIKRIYPCTILTYRSLDNIKEPIAQKKILRFFFKKKFEQIHVYTNMHSGDNEYGKLFHELFKPSKELQLLIDKHIDALGGEKRYNAIVFRFRQLLGDFKEGGRTLPVLERENYINRCIELIEREHTLDVKQKLLVTSDSVTFLKIVSVLPYVYVIPGKVVHIGFTYGAEKKTYMKSFVDYFVLSHAKKITLVRDNIMYHSGFALRASMLNNANYSEVWLRR